jgi:hypothetical protein
VATNNVACTSTLQKHSNKSNEQKGNGTAENHQNVYSGAVQIFFFTNSTFASRITFMKSPDRLYSNIATSPQQAANTLLPLHNNSPSF